ncbi:fimbria/pilus periplasmic chaperone [Lysobacter sp. MMG2]|uniref:fimbrial biogenesis chaperone n=1 Tax=Lysobacter sp. MMG2 TaxID=2801338 RepID=UPI001C20FC5E|nr:fimbria/pilus periplasmic chaperone [Lysobacter sp. MMG2]MBU8977438.1 fimbria/pilus periplasmic chaperone [Lysobacter sp. MMG2]
MKTLSRTLSALVLTLVGGLSAAHAGIQIVGTRVIYPASHREVTVQVTNKGDVPRLIQSWTDSGNPEESPETSKAPFLITPPISRIDPGKGQALRLMFTGAQLPQDRESVFYLNVLEIPPAPKADQDNNYLQFAVRTRIKIFYRPTTLQGNPEASVDQLGWRMVRQGDKLAVECTNGTAYNVSMTYVRLKDAKNPTKVGDNGGMCPAMGRQTFPLENGADSGRIVFDYINDYGATVEHEAAYTR